MTSANVEAGTANLTEEVTTIAKPGNTESTYGNFENVIYGGNINKSCGFSDPPGPM